MSDQPMQSYSAWLTVSAVAHRCGVDPRTVRRWIQRGILPAVRIGPQNLRVHPRELAAVIKPVEVKS